jgi:hypothetical protein
MSPTRSSSLVLAPLTLLLSACTAEVSTTEESIASVQDPIINGTAMNAHDSGVVYLSSPCTGTLITNTKVLTAKHCVASYQNNPSALSVVMGPSNTGQATDIFVHPTSTVDVAVVWIKPAFYMFGSRTGYRRDIAQVTADQLHNGGLVIHGYGRNTGTGGSGIFNLRYGVCSSKKRATGLVSCFPGGDAQTIQSFGDSGGPGSVYTAGLPVVYVQSGCFFTNGTNAPPTECYGNSSDAWGSWAWWYLH